MALSEAAIKRNKKKLAEKKKKYDIALSYDPRPGEKKIEEPIDLGDVVALVKTKLVTAPHRNPTNEKIRVRDRPGKPREKKMVNPARGFSGGGSVKKYAKGGGVRKANYK